MNAAWFDDAFETAPVMAILRGGGAEHNVALATRAWDLGIDIVEVTIQSPQDVDALVAVVEAGARRGRPVGAGTVVTAADVSNAKRAGAAFTVSPGFDPEIVTHSLDAGMAPLPGVASASEIQQALTMGLTWVKAFPAGVLGTAWFDAMRGPFPHVRFVATGGIDASNARSFLDAGAQVVAVGSALSDPTQLPKLAKLLAAK